MGNFKGDQTPGSLRHIRTAVWPLQVNFDIGRSTSTTPINLRFFDFGNTRPGGSGAAGSAWREVRSADGVEAEDVRDRR